MQESKVMSMDTCRVFILYSNYLFGEGVESLLRRQPGLEVIGLEGCGERALASVRVLQPDVVVIDANDREVYGREFLPRILQENPAIRVVCLSMADNNIDVYHRHQVLATRGEDLVEAIQMI